MIELPRPLDPLRSIKLKLAILMVGSGAVAFGYFSFVIGWLPPTTIAIAMTLALVTSQLLAHGMTSPLREMTAAARAMARGDYSRRVRVTSRDEVGELGRAFNHMAADLAEVDRQRRELIANVSHELRTPITALQGMLENLVDGVSTPNPATLRTALAQTERLSRLVAELLDLSRIDAGVAPLDRQEFDVGPFLDEAVDEAAMTSAGAGRGVTFRTAATPEHIRGYADRERLHQVLANLLNNAARHSPPGGTVTLTASAGGGGLVLDVTDEGPGIPSEQRVRVFERFTRGGRTSGDGGTGLGLAIAHWIVGLHGGTIAVVDVPERATVGVGGVPAPALSPGCRIRVTLPGP
jgi:signal transduction histidine kinase